MKSSRGSSFLILLFVVFLVLRLTGVIDWSWWWVTSPLWLPAALVLGGLLLAAVLGLTTYKVVASVLRKRGAQASEGWWSGRAQADDSAEAVVVEVIGSEVVDGRTEGTEPAALPAAESTSEPAERGSGPERS